MTLFTEVRRAIRSLWRTPGYTATVVCTLALAIGANSAIFGAVYAVLLRPLPVASPEDLAVAWQTDEGGQAVVELTYRHLQEWRKAGTTFTAAAVMASHNWDAVLEGHGAPERIWFAGVSGTFFDVLGVAPILGRALGAGDDVPNGPGVAVLHHDTWVRRFGSDPGVVGTTMRIDGEPVEIVGVMPAGLDVPRGAEFWTPVVPILASGTPPSTTALERVGVFYVLGRTRTGLAPDMAAREIDDTERQLDLSTPGRLVWGARAVVTPFSTFVFGPIRPALFSLWGAVGILLAVACANVAGLMLTRASTRRHEHAVRAALGATPAQLGRMWLAESFVIAALGGAVGLWLASALLRAVVTLAPDDVPRLADIAVDLRVGLFTLLAIVGTAGLTSLAPWRLAASGHWSDALHGLRATASLGTRRARSSLLVAQIGCAVVLVIAAGLVVRSFGALRSVDVGFVSDHVLTASVRPQGATLGPNAWMDRLLTDVRALPSVDAAGAVLLRPLMLGPIGQGVQVTLEGQPDVPASADRNPTLNYQVATPGYFEAMRVRLLRGRTFTADDRAGAARVAVVGARTAARLWPGQDAIGRRVLMSTFTPGVPGRDWRTVVGVVSDVRYRGLDEVQLDIYDPALQVGLAAQTLVVRTTAPTAETAARVTQLARALDGGVIVDGVTTMNAVVERAQAPWRLTMWLFVAFAVLALGLAALGIVSVVALDVANRRREFAVLLTLGASPRGVVLQVLRGAGLRAGAGIALGVVAARASAHLLSGVLFEVTPHDEIAYAAAVSAIACVVIVAVLVPSIGAARVEPQILLRQD